METHDLSSRTWGNDYAITDVIDGGRMLKASGWRNGIKVGDFVILKNDNDTTRYKVSEIRYMRDPRDMWFATLEFAPRERIEVSR